VVHVGELWDHTVLCHDCFYVSRWIISDFRIDDGQHDKSI
jgi:hypothetical protein